MSDHVYKKIEVVGTSAKGVDDAIRNAIETANKTVNNIGWFEVIETTGRVVEGKITQIQVTVKIGFKLEKD
jgi:flavin-binding protein dodecin